MIETTIQQRKEVYEKAIKFLEDPNEKGYPTGLCIILANILITDDATNQRGYYAAEWHNWGYHFKQQFPELRWFDYPGAGYWTNWDRIRMLKSAIEECDKLSVLNT